jgi:hypothetical protein
MTSTPPTYTLYQRQDGLSYDIAKYTNYDNKSNDAFLGICRSVCNNINDCKGFVLNINKTKNDKGEDIVTYPECWIKGFTQSTSKPAASDTIFEKEGRETHLKN